MNINGTSQHRLRFPKMSIYWSGVGNTPRWWVRRASMKSVSDNFSSGHLAQTKKGALRQTGKMNARGEGFFADEPASQDADGAAESIAGVQDFHRGAAVHHEQFFVSDQQGDSQIVVGGFAIGLFAQKFLGGREQNIVAAGVVADRYGLPDPFHVRSGRSALLASQGRSRRISRV